VFDKDEKKIYTTMLAIPNDRLEPADKPIVLFSERASGSPQAVKVWFYPGERIGNEFVYPKTQAMRIAKDTHQSVLAMNNDSKMANTAGEIPVEAKSAALGRFDENGTWQSDSDKTVTMSNPPAAKTTTTQASTTTASTAPSTASGASAATTTSGTRTQTTTASKSGSRAQTTTAGTSGSRTQTSTAGTSGDRPARQHLPRTASSLALMELLSGLSIAGGFAARRLREYIS